MEISRKTPTAKGGDEFTGDVWIDPITGGPAPSRFTVLTLRLAPGARSAERAAYGGHRRRPLAVTTWFCRARGSRCLHLRRSGST